MMIRKIKENLKFGKEKDLRVGLATVNSLAWGQLTPLNADVEAKLVVQSDF